MSPNHAGGHGSASSYSQGCRCDACRKARADYVRERGYEVGPLARARKNRWEHEHRARCACGRLTSRYNQERCVACRRRADREARDARRAEIARLWLAGAKYGEIAAALVSTPKTIQVELTRMRQDGWQVPKRGPRGKHLDAA